MDEPKLSKTLLWALGNCNWYLDKKIHHKIQKIIIIISPEIHSFNLTLPTECRDADADLTLQNVNCGAVVPLLDDTAALGQAGGMHAVHDG